VKRRKAVKRERRLRKEVFATRFQLSLRDKKNQSKKLMNDI